MITETETVGLKPILVSDMPSTLYQGIYELFKIRNWSRFLKRSLLPVKWSRPFRSGTYAYVQPLINETDVSKAWDDLLEYIGRINSRYGFNLTISLEMMIG